MGSTETLAIAAALLVLVASLPAPAGAGVRLGLLGYVVALLAGTVLVFRAFDATGAQPDTRPAMSRKYAAREFPRAAARNVLLIDGGSYALNAVDIVDLTNRLTQLGYSVQAIKLTFSASNHFDRFRLYEDIKRDLRSGPLPGQRWLFLLEAQEGYDNEPLAQFDRNQDTARAYHYLTPTNAWYAFRAEQSPGVRRTQLDDWAWRLTRHALINAFNVGLANRLVGAEQIEDWDGLLSDPGGKSRYRFKGLGKLIAEAKSPRQGPAVPPWLFDIREARLRSLWQREVSTWIYFGVPSTKLEQLRYLQSFCKATPLPCIEPDARLLEALNKQTYWRNAGHLTRQGAGVYTDWFTQELVELNLLVK